MPNLTPRRQQALEFIHAHRDYRRLGVTCRQLATYLGVRPQTATRIAEQLALAGVVGLRRGRSYVKGNGKVDVRPLCIVPPDGVPDPTAAVLAKVERFLRDTPIPFACRGECRLLLQEVSAITGNPVRESA